jgi:hypothetical protein
VPEQIAVVDQRSELIDAFAQPLIRPQFSQEGDDIPQHEECISVQRILARLDQRRLDTREGRLG